MIVSLAGHPRGEFPQLTGVTHKRPLIGRHKGGGYELATGTDCMLQLLVNPL